MTPTRASRDNDKSQQYTLYMYSAPNNPSHQIHPVYLRWVVYLIHLQCTKQSQSPNPPCIFALGSIPYTCIVHQTIPVTKSTLYICVGQYTLYIYSAPNNPSHQIHPVYLRWVVYLIHVQCTKQSQSPNPACIFVLDSIDR